MDPNSRAALKDFDGRGREPHVHGVVNHLISSAGFCPRLDESTGKRRSAYSEDHALAHTHVDQRRVGRHAQEGLLSASALPADQSRRGTKTAILAVASSMLTAAYFMLRGGVEYHDHGARHFEQRDKDQLAKPLIRRLRDLGVAVEVKAA